MSSGVGSRARRRAQPQLLMGWFTWWHQVYIMIWQQKRGSLSWKFKHDLLQMLCHVCTLFPAFFPGLLSSVSC